MGWWDSPTFQQDEEKKRKQTASTGRYEAPSSYSKLFSVDPEPEPELPSWMQ